MSPKKENKKKYCNMNKKQFILAALASVALTSCTQEEFAGDNSRSTEHTSGMITFSGGSSAITRADLYGATAAEKLGNKFVVYGTKHAAAEDKSADNDAVVFNNFQVAWTANTAGQTTTNSSDWEYVGQGDDQSIKYWDWSAKAYRFFAYAKLIMSVEHLEH